MHCTLKNTFPLLGRKIKKKDTGWQAIFFVVGNIKKGDISLYYMVKKMILSLLIFLALRFCVHFLTHSSHSSHSFFCFICHVFYVVKM